MSNLDKISGINYECSELRWDTDYFGIKSARIKLNGLVDEEGQGRILDFCKKYEFVTIANINNIKENNHWIGLKTRSFLVDINMQYKKKVEVSKNISNNDNILVINDFPRDKKVLMLVGNAFVYSRFFNDPFLPKEKARDIYIKWTNSAFNNPNKYFLIYKDENTLYGYILFSFIDNKVIIELIAVDEDHRGRKIGSTLIEELEVYLKGKDIENIIVGTQVDNIYANEFYKKIGFKYISCNSIYHLWNRDLRDKRYEYMDN